MRVSKCYKWAEVLEGGVLKEPEGFGPYKDDDLNEWGGFKTETEALEAWGAFSDKHNFGVPTELILIPVYTMQKGD